MEWDYRLVNKQIHCKSFHPASVNPYTWWVFSGSGVKMKLNVWENHYLVKYNSHSTSNMNPRSSESFEPLKSLWFTFAITSSAAYVRLEVFCHAKLEEAILVEISSHIRLSGKTAVQVDLFERSSHSGLPATRV